MIHKYHGDVLVESEVLGLRVSYHWNPIMDNDVMDSLREWATSKKDEAPHFILIGRSGGNSRKSRNFPDSSLNLVFLLF